MFVYIVRCINLVCDFLDDTKKVEVFRLIYFHRIVWHTIATTHPLTNIEIYTKA